MIGTKTFAGGDEHFSRLSINGNVVDFVADERAVLCGEMLNGFQSIGTEQINAIVEGSHPFAITSIDGDTFDGYAIQQIVA